MLFFVRYWLLILGCGFFGFYLPVQAAASTTPAYQEIKWEALVPTSWRPDKAFKGLDLAKLPDDDPRVEKAYAAFMTEWAKAPINKKMHGQRVKIPGYIVPLDWENSAELKEILLVPYFGACIHLPPPPANQIIYIKLQNPLKGYQSMDTIWVYGTILVEKNDADSMGTSGYRMQVDKVERYQ